MGFLVLTPLSPLTFATGYQLKQDTVRSWLQKAPVKAIRSSLSPLLKRDVLHKLMISSKLPQFSQHSIPHISTIPVLVTSPSDQHHS